MPDLYVVPFIVMLAITGLIQVYGNSIETPLGKMHFVSWHGRAPEQSSPRPRQPRPQSPAARSQCTCAPRTGTCQPFPGQCRRQADCVAVDPYTVESPADRAAGRNMERVLTNIHGDLLVGGMAARRLRDRNRRRPRLLWSSPGSISGGPATAARLGSCCSQLQPEVAARSGRNCMSPSVSGSPSSCCSFFFLALPGPGFWGSKFTQAWSTFPPRNGTTFRFPTKTMPA